MPSNNSLNPKLKSFIEAKDNNNNQILSKDNQDYQNSRILINKYLFLILLTTIEKQKSLSDPTSQNQFVSFPQNVPQFQSKSIKHQKISKSVEKILEL